LKQSDRNTALRLLAMLLMTILFSSLATDAELGIGGLFVGWGLSTVLLGKLLVVLFGSGRVRYPSGGVL
jgi:hypothetical protein